MEIKNTTQLSNIIEQISEKNPLSIEKFGEDYSNILNRLSDSLSMSETKLKSLGSIGDNISSLLEISSSLDVNLLTEKQSFFSKIFSDAKSNISKFVEKQKSVEEVITNIVNKLSKNKLELLSENENLGQCYIDNMTVLQEMEILVTNGIKKLEFLKQTLQLDKETNTEHSDIFILECQNREYFIERFEQKLNRLNSVKSLIIRQLPQIKIMQTANQLEIDNITDTITSAIPLWKSQMGLFISQLKTKTALKNRKAVEDTINKTIRKNAELINQNTQEISESYSSDIISVETITVLQQKLIESINVMKNASKEAKRKREESFLEISKMDIDLKKISLS